MQKNIGYFCGNDNEEIAAFSAAFETESGRCLLSENDQSALVSVLSVHAWGLKSGLEDDFWTNVDHAIGDGVETSLEEDDEKDDEDKSSPMWEALSILSEINDPSPCYSLIAYFVQ